MKFKDAGTIIITTETGRRFVYHFQYDTEGKITAGYFIGTCGDIFPFSKEDIAMANSYICGEDEITTEKVQSFFTTTVISVKAECA